MNRRTFFATLFAAPIAAVAAVKAKAATKLKNLPARHFTINAGILEPRTDDERARMRVIWRRLDAINTDKPWGAV